MGHKILEHLNQRALLGSICLSLNKLERLLDLISMTCCANENVLFLVGGDKESSYGDSVADPS